MIDHTGIGVSDVTAAALFYDAALGALGLRRAMQMPDGVGTDGIDGIDYGDTYPVFWIDRFHPHSQRTHVAFAAKNPAAVHAFHHAALAAGGKDNGGPGPRGDQSTAVYYAAFVLDLDGNNTEAVFRW